eukprot:CAMPEP_0179423392 /NCGR_PEP_ID=MMETSP0799-20121207/10983_1 /TAXON_ID=46947 /ORGANISM="Geminigera cryophila, Strain CCMP2564" /LENGTH=93 /DNA_ID=CAMNT_0021197679 /DNA_START=410 /DNA_END=691 /DNA_ORIENTATION=+
MLGTPTIAIICGGIKARRASASSRPSTPLMLTTWALAASAAASETASEASTIHPSPNTPHNPTKSSNASAPSPALSAARTTACAPRTAARAKS